MAKICRLTISGIRSFGPEKEDVQEITFSSPVTLILGENGSGKTTIIEALKYACTGRSPGASFVYNPRLHAGSLTKARIRLKIIGKDKQEIVVNRGMKVEQLNKVKQRFSSIDATISIKDKDGNNVPVSTRCMDIVALLNGKLGVSDSILNNVIFCHQDNSSWPLDEGKKLKEKFDEIFDSSQYNKCIDDLTGRKKDLLNDLKKRIKGKLDDRRDRKDLVERRRAELHKHEFELERLERSIAEKEEKINPIKSDMSKICKKEDTIGALQQTLSSKETERRGCQGTQNEIRKKLREEFKGTEEELFDKIKNFEEKINALPNEAQIKKDIERCAASIQKTQVRIGQLEAEKKQHLATIAERNTKIAALNRELNLETGDLDAANSEVRKAIQNLRTSLDRMRMVINDFEKERSDEENSVQASIDRTRSEFVKIEENIRSNKLQVKEIEQKLRDTDLELKRLGTADEQVRNFNGKLETIDVNLKKLSESVDVKSVEQKIKGDKQEIQRLEGDLENLERDYRILQKNFALENDIETRSRDIREKENKIYEIISKHHEDFKQLFPEVPDRLMEKITEILDENKKTVDQLRKKIDAKKIEVTRHETNMKCSKQKLDVLEGELASTTDKISKLTDNKPYENLGRDLEDTLEKLQKSKGQLSSAKIMYETFVRKFQSEKPCCPLCETDFDNKQGAVKIIVNKINDRIRSIPDELVKVEDQLRKKQEHYNQIQQLKPIYERNDSLKSSLVPKATSDVSSLTEKVNSCKSELDSFNDQIKKPEKLVQVSRRVISDAALVDKYRNEVNVYKNEILDLQSQLTQIESEKSRDEVEAEINLSKVNVSQKRQLCESNQKKIDNFKEQCQSLREDRNKVFDKRLQLEKSMHGKPQLLERQIELKSTKDRLHEETKKLQADLEPVDAKLATLINDLDELRAENKAKISKRHDARNKLNTIFENINEMHRQIEIFKEKDVDREFETQLENYRLCKSKSDELASQRDVLASSRTEQRELEDNRDLREKQKTIVKLNEEISVLKTQIGDFNYEKLQTEKRRLEREYSALVKDISNIDGQRTQLSSTIDSCRVELDRKENKEAYSNYKAVLFEKHVAEKAIGDLQLFIRGLENAIIEFHKEKMTRINKFIKDYWKNIYKGNDIDYIQIKTEQMKGAENALRRVFNYKVVQVRDGHEFDMRGCCSAGQKVLACLIIRMALSTVFSHTCGILALDEPTTNLDRENIESLSGALEKMIEYRSVEKNFQLLIITHDREFLRMLSRSSRIDSFLHVKRNHQGKSIVTEKEFSK